MRGLPFPTNAIFDREATSDHGTPFSSADDIPIDPALAGTLPVDPAIANGVNVPPNAFEQIHLTVPFVDAVPPRTRHYSQEPLQYDQGPQGDPFAPQPPAAYLPIPDEQVAPIPKPQKRRRKPRREEECGFCQGNDSKNKEGQPEVMVSCEECGRSGHPTCMELGRVADVVRSYPWKCIECKTCEICQEKGDDARILFCDFCDRGWHMDCLQPPLEEEPPGKWHCPRCPPIELFSPALDLLPREDALPATSPHQVDAGQHQTLSDPEPDADDNLNVEADADADDGSSSDSSDSDSDDDDTVGVPTPRRAQPPVKRRKNPPKQKSDPRTPRPAKRMRIRVRSPAPPLIVRLRLPPKGKGKEREDDAERSLFEDLLAPGERDVSKTTIDTADRARFDKSRLAAEEKLAPSPAVATSMAEISDTPVAGPSSRPLRSHALHRLSIPSAVPTPSPVPSTPTPYPPTPGPIPQTPNTPVDNDSQSPSLRIRTIRFGQYDIHPWYDAPFPEEYANIPDGRLWICEFCLKYMRSGFAFGRHRMKCKARHPPGDEIYRDGAISIFEVDGRKNKIYCQNLCLLSKMFLDHKSLFYDVEPFLFYVMTEIDDIGARFVGYFSKEKCSPKDYNVSCIMTLPVRQRQGWGNFLIDFSYLLSKKEQRAGSPEKPLSALGALGYKNYWTLALMRYLKIAPAKLTLEDISLATSMTIEDIYNTLIHLNMITVYAATPPVRPSPGQSIKFPRGRKNGIARKHLQRTNTQKEDAGGSGKSSPFVAPARYEITWDPASVAHWLDVWEKKSYLRLSPEKLKWTPFVLTRIKATGDTVRAEMGIGLGAMNGMIGANTPVTPMENGTPMMVDGSEGVEPSVPAVAAAVTEQVETRSSPGTLAGGGMDIPAARLFDDELDVDPRKQSRSRLKEGTVPRSAYSRTESSRQTTDDHPVLTLRQTRSAPVRPAVDPGKDDTDSVLNETPNELEASTPVPIKRRRGRPPRARPPDAVPPILVPEVSTNPMLRSSTPRLTPPGKRRRVDSPIHEGTRPVGHDGIQACRPVNGQAPTTNGFHPHSERYPSDKPDVDNSTSFSVGPTGETKGVGAGERLHHDDLARHDVKSEDVGTPLTGLTSRHSVPSDDTVYVPDANSGTGVSHKNSGEVEDILPSLESPGRPPVLGQVGAEFGNHTIDGDSDLDAEGEPDDEISQDGPCIHTASNY